MIMPKSPPPEDPSDPEHSQNLPRLTEEQVQEAFSGITEEYFRQSLTGPRDYSPTEDDERFVPPDPGPITSTDAFLTLGWALLGGGLLIIVLSLMFWPGAPRSFHIGCALATVTGGAILTWRMPKHRNDDDDTGAVV